MSAYYNEFEPYAAAWLRELIKRGLIAQGDVDERSILEVSPDDLRGYTQCHFFAGIGGWSYALRLAGWSDDRFVWTGSCPCQPFSSAGQQRGAADERHLWPAFFRLIRECRPSTIFGEQVSGAAGLAWVEHVLADLETCSYACAALDLPACSVGAPHRRQRLWWVADSVQRRWREGFQCEGGNEKSGRIEKAERSLTRDKARGVCSFGSMADASSATGERNTGSVFATKTGISGAWQLDGHLPDGHCNGSPTGLWSSPWADLFWLPCSDGKARPTQPGLFPLAHGVSGRVGRLRAYGNAIVPQVAAEFVAAYMDIIK